MSTLHLRVLAAGALIGTSPISIAQALAQDNVDSPETPTGSPSEAPLIPITPFQGYVLGAYSEEEQANPGKRDPVVQVLPDAVNVWTKSEITPSSPIVPDESSIENYIDSLTAQEEPVFVFDSERNLYSFGRQDESLVIYRHMLSSDWRETIEDQLNPFTSSEVATTTFSPDWATIYANREIVNDTTIDLGQLGQLSVENGIVADTGTVSMGMPFIDFSDHTQVSTGSKDSIVQPSDLAMDQSSLAPLELSTGISRLISQ